MENLTSKYLINGPNNAVRLTNGEKVLYIFGDQHVQPQYQQECPINDDYDSIDIDKLLLKFMKNEKNKKFDLFIEYYKSHLISENDNTLRKRYIDQVFKLSNTNINIENNKITINKKYPNFRFHYFDIRDTIEIYESFYSYQTYEYYFPYTIDSLRHIIINTKNIIDKAYLFIEYLNKNENISINKILNVYENQNIKKKINNIFNEIVVKNIEENIKNLKKIIILFEESILKLQNKFLDERVSMKIQSELYIKYSSARSKLAIVVLIITDLYFIRRFLDKKYIKNSIIYTGAMHMNDIAFLLIKYFNFKLTNIYYKDKSFNVSKIKNLKTINLEYLDILGKYTYNCDEDGNIKQCCDLFNFPPNFS